MNSGIDLRTLPPHALARQALVLYIDNKGAESALDALAELDSKLTRREELEDAGEFDDEMMPDGMSLREAPMGVIP